MELKPEHFKKEDYQWIANAIDRFFNGDAIGPNRKIGFSLFVFAFDNEMYKPDQPRVNYVSNAMRDDMIAAVEDWLTQAKKQMNDDPLQEGEL